MICHNLILKSYPNIYHLILLCDFVLVNIDKVLKLEGWLLYFWHLFKVHLNYISKDFCSNLRITHNTTLLFDLDLYDGLHMSSLLLHVKVDVNTIGYGIYSSYFKKENNHIMKKLHVRYQREIMINSTLGLGSLQPKSIMTWNCNVKVDHSICHINEYHQNFDVQ